MSSSLDVELLSRRYAPCHDSITLALDSSTVAGPVKALNPTRARYNATTFDNKKQPQLKIHWTSRNNRKGRHIVIIPRPEDATLFTQLERSCDLTVATDAQTPTGTLRRTLVGIRRMFTRCPIYDISYDVAVLFTLGSAVFVLNGMFAVLPFVRPGARSDNEALYGGGITAVIDGTIFQLGGMLLMLETVNENREGCFGWAVERLAERDLTIGNPDGVQIEHCPDASLDDKGDKYDMNHIRLHMTPSSRECTHHHSNRHNLVGPGLSRLKTDTFGVEYFLSRKIPSYADTPKANPRLLYPPSWTWLPTLHALRTHYLRTIAFHATLIQLVATTIFYIPCFVALPSIYPTLTPSQSLHLNYLPQLVGGIGFVIASALFTLETQTQWWKLAPRTLGWWIGAWNLLGGVGFTLSPSFGLVGKQRWAQEQAAWCTLWGSAAFLVGSVLLWWESLDKWSVQYERV